VVCGFEAELVVPVEGCSTDGEGGVAYGEPCVGEGVGLGKLEGVEVGGDGVVGGVFKIWGRKLVCCFLGDRNWEYY
jgi:hypothetical protein